MSGTWDAMLAHEAERRPCYHPLSCRRCYDAGEPCGRHAAGEACHERCVGRAPTKTTNHNEQEQR